MVPDLSPAAIFRRGLVVVGVILSVALPAGSARGGARLATSVDFATSLDHRGALELELKAMVAVRDSQLTPGVGWKHQPRVLRAAPLDGDALVQLSRLLAHVDTAVTYVYPSPICDTCTEVIQHLFDIRKRGGDKRILLQVDPCAQTLLLSGPEVGGAVVFQEDTLGIIRLLQQVLEQEGRGTNSSDQSIDCEAHERGLVGNVQLCAVERSVRPAYPLQARESGVEGTVLVDTLVGTDGSVVSTHIRESIPLLDSAAVESVRQWKFVPAQLKGAPIAVWVVCPVKFAIH